MKGLCTKSTGLPGQSRSHLRFGTDEGPLAGDPVDEPFGEEHLQACRTVVRLTRKVHISSSSVGSMSWGLYSWE